MIKVKRFVCNMIAENCYVVSDDTKEAIIIDCGALYEDERKAIVAYINSEQLAPVRLLCTHGHFDHIFGNNTISEHYGLLPEVHADDQWLIEDLKGQVRNMLGAEYHIPVPPVGRYLSETDVIRFGHHCLTILHTPGHTPGSILFYCEEEHAVFTGDTLFRMSIGRTDFERGSYDDMMKSMQNIVKSLPPETVAYCGHGPETTLREELLMNPYLR